MTAVGRAVKVGGGIWIGVEDGKIAGLAVEVSTGTVDVGIIVSACSVRQATRKIPIRTVNQWHATFLLIMINNAILVRNPAG